MLALYKKFEERIKMATFVLGTLLFAFVAADLIVYFFY